MTIAEIRNSDAYTNKGPVINERAGQQIALTDHMRFTYVAVLLVLDYVVLDYGRRGEDSAVRTRCAD
jgi:hypothetical protein